MRKIFTLIAVLLSITTLFAQDLPRYMTPDEINMLPHYRFPTNDSKAITTPPPGPLRAAAEWEEIQSLEVTWTSFTPLLTEIVRYAREECEVIIICTDSNTVKTSLTNAGVTLSNIHYLVHSYNTIWMRDYGANSVYMNDVDSLILVDWIYNRPRPQDDTVPSGIARYKHLQLFSTTQAPNDLVATGGNYMSDGLGTLMSSKLTLLDNDASMPYGATPKTADQIDTIFKKFLGINRHVWWDVLPYDLIHHIDMHAKLMDEETLMMGQYPTGISDGPQIEANLQYLLSNYNSIFGTPYRIIRMPQPPMANGQWPDNNGDYLTYTNCVFINKTVLMPKYYAQYDTTGYRIMKNSLAAGYRVIQLDCNSIISQSGAIHCITHSIGVADPLLIVHQPIHDNNDTTTPYQVDARIQHKSGISNATIYYRMDTLQPYQTATMTLTNASLNTWTGFIPAQPDGSTIYYYIDANANSGKHQIRPITAPTGYWKFHISTLTGITNASAFIIKDIYPNPGNAITCIPVSSNTNTALKLTLLDITGREVMQVYNGNIPSGDKNLFIDCSTLKTGVYLLQFNTESGIYTKKLCVK